jgi:hypothetical protein
MDLPEFLKCRTFRLALVCFVRLSLPLQVSVDVGRVNQLTFLVAKQAFSFTSASLNDVFPPALGAHTIAGGGDTATAAQQVFAAAAAAAAVLKVTVFTNDDAVWC